jgi:hypothetical protein
MARKQFETSVALNPNEQRFRDALAKTNMSDLSKKMEQKTDSVRNR